MDNINIYQGQYAIGNRRLAIVWLMDKGQFGGVKSSMKKLELKMKPQRAQSKQMIRSQILKIRNDN